MAAKCSSIAFMPRGSNAKGAEKIDQPNKPGVHPYEAVARVFHAYCSTCANDANHQYNAPGHKGKNAYNKNWNCKGSTPKMGANNELTISAVN